jgi:hypothetical protein
MKTGASSYCFNSVLRGSFGGIWTCFCLFFACFQPLLALRALLGPISSPAVPFSSIKSASSPIGTSASSYFIDSKFNLPVVLTLPELNRLGVIQSFAQAVIVRKKRLATPTNRHTSKPYQPPQQKANA